MERAIVFAAGTGLDGEDLRGFPTLRIGGNEQLKRQLIIAQRAGIGHFTIVTASDPDTLSEITSDKRITGTVSWHHPGEPLDIPDSPHLIIQSNLVTTPGALEPLVARGVEPDGVAVLTGTSGDRSGTPVALKAGSTSVREAFATADPLRALVERSGAVTVPFENDYWMFLTATKGSIGEAEALLYANVSKSVSGWLSRDIYIKISLPVSRLLLKTPLTPNMISALIGAIGMTSGLLFILGWPVLAMCFIMLSTILDRCDGEVARIKLRETRYGQWIDTSFDQLSFLSMVVGAHVGYYLYTGSYLAVVLGILNISMQTFFLVWTAYFIKRYCNSGSIVAYISKIDGMFPYEERSSLVKMIYWLRPVVRRANFSPILLLTAIFGGFAYVLVGITMVMGLMFIHLFDDFIRVMRLEARHEQIPGAPLNT